MAKICIISDSSVSLFPKDAKKLNVEIAPLSIMINGKEHQDLINIQPEDIIKSLKAGDEITTSQPNIGYLDELMERLKAEKYDHILVFTIAGYLSGTYNAFRLAVSNHDMENVTIVDTKSASGPIRHIVVEARKMADAGASVQSILDFANRVIEDTMTYILPDNLEQLRKGGRVKGAVATLSNLLKIKLCLYINKDVTTIEKFGTDRVETRLYQSIYEDMKKRGFNAKTHKIYMPECDAVGRVEGFKAFLLKQEPDTDIEVIVLPAGIAAHVGLNTFGVQTALKA